MMESSGALGGVSTSSRYSGFWRRFFGALIDGIIVGVVAAIIRALLSALGADSVAFSTLLGFIIALVYFGWGYGTGQTVGCMVLNMRIVDQATGGPPGYGKAVIRYVVQAILGVTGILALIGDLWMIWDAKKQTWQDKVAGTIVVDA